MKYSKENLHFYKNQFSINGIKVKFTPNKFEVNIKIP